MCHLSPTVHLAWAILSCGLQITLVQHLWRYDRFNCLKWSSGRQPGAFKRVMTYSYCASVPLLLLYSVTMAVFKYKHGYTVIPGHGIVPTPFQFWPESDRAWLTPLYLVFSVTWALELVTHTEELTFWLFLLHQGPAKRDWFSSTEFKTWAISSLISMAGMPLTVIFARSDPLKAEAYVFLAGSSASTCITAVFFVVLFKFPAFLRRVKREGAASVVVLRLVKFHELNIMRVIFRLLFTLPFLCLGIDGVMHHHTLNTSALWSDFLAFIGAFGTVISSTLTLLIFFPRSLAEDSNWRPRSILLHSRASHTSGRSSQGRLSAGRPESEQNESPFFTDYMSSGRPPQMSKSKTKYYSGHFTSPSALTTAYHPPALQPDLVTPSHAGEDWDLHTIEEGDGRDGDVSEDSPKAWQSLDAAMDLAYNSRHSAAELSRRGDDPRNNENSRDDANLKVRMMELGQAVDAAMRKPVRPPRLHPYIMSFTSPIDLLEDDEHVPRAI